MKKPIFNLGLYLEGLRQTRLHTIIGSALLCLFSFFSIASTWLAAVESKRQVQMQGIAFTKISLSGTDAANLLIVVAFVWVPLMTLALYGFGNKRNTSDFYHSIPHSRLCTYLSFQSALLTQAFAMLAINLVFVFAMSALVSSMVTLVVVPLLWYALSTLVCAVLCAAAVSGAMAITGTTFTNVILSGIIIFLPRIMMFIFRMILGSTLFNVVESNFLPFASPKLNMIIGFCFSILGIDGIDMNTQISYMPAILYSLALALCYTVASALLFCRRKSESAGFSAPSRLLQATYRIIIGSAITSISTLALYQTIVGQGYLDLSSHIIVWTLGVFAYFLYEILTTRKWKNLVRAIPGLGIVLVINLLAVGGAHAVYTAEMNYTPDADQIKNISIVTEADDSRWTNIPEYVMSKTGDVKITDRELISLVATYLKKNVDDYREMGEREFNNYYYGDHKYEDENGEPAVQAFTQMTFKIETAMGAKYRQVWYPLEKRADFAKVLEEDEEYRKILTTLPTMIEGTGHLSSSYFYGSQMQLSDEQIERLLAMYREEVRSCDFATWYEQISQGHSNEMFRINYSFLDGVRVRQIEAAIYPEVAPRTMEIIFDCFKDSGKEFFKAVDELNKVEGKYVDTYFNSMLYLPGMGDVFYIELGYSDEKYDPIALLREHQKDVSEYETGDAVIFVTMEYFPGGGKDDYQVISALIVLDMTQNEIFETFLRDYGFEIDKNPIPEGEGVVTTKPEG